MGYLEKKRNIFLSDIKKARLPKEYQEVEWIQRPGAPKTNKCYIKTGVNSQVGLEIELKVDSLYDDNFHYAILGSYGGIQTKVISHQYSCTNMYTEGFFTKYGQVTYKAGVDSNSRYIYYDNQYYSAGKNSKNYEVYLFTLNGLNQGNTQGPQDGNGVTRDTVAQFNGEFYYCKVLLNKEIIREFIPCYRKADEEIGLYDLINDKFYSNDGTGQFTKGPNV